MRLLIILYQKSLRIEDSNIIFYNKLEEIEYKEQKFKCYYAKFLYTPYYCESCGALNTNHIIVNIVLK